MNLLIVETGRVAIEGVIAKVLAVIGRHNHEGVVQKVATIQFVE